MWPPEWGLVGVEESRTIYCIVRTTLSVAAHPHLEPAPHLPQHILGGHNAVVEGEHRRVGAADAQLRMRKCMGMRGCTALEMGKLVRCPPPTTATGSLAHLMLRRSRRQATERPIYNKGRNLGLAGRPTRHGGARKHRVNLRARRVRRQSNTRKSNIKLTAGSVPDDIAKTQGGWCARLQSKTKGVWCATATHKLRSPTPPHHPTAHTCAMPPLLIHIFCPLSA